MAKLTKKQKEVAGKIDKEALYSISDASKLLKEITNVNFDASVDVAVRLGVDPRKADQMVRGGVKLPNGTGRDVVVLALVPPDKEEAARAAGADHVGLDDYIQKIKGGWLEIDTLVTMPSVMGKLGALGKILGPRGLMPNPKTGTVTMDVPKAVSEIKAGRIDFRVDKYGIVHASIGRVSFTVDQIVENFSELLDTIVKMKPSTSKGLYLKGIHLSSTMSLGIPIDAKTI